MDDEMIDWLMIDEMIDWLMIDEMSDDWWVMVDI